MTRKHFNQLSDSLKLLRADLNRASADGCDNSINLALEAHVNRVASICAGSNPAFNRSRFIDATKD